MASVVGRRSAVVALVVLLISAAAFTAAPQSSAASAVDIVILGGESAVSSAVSAELRTCTTGTVSRLAGTNRYGTAAAISKATFSSANGAYIATGLNFPDALAGGPTAALNDQPVLLVHDAVPASTLLELDRLGVSSVTVLGGSSVVPDSVVTSLNARVPTARVAGSDRYATAAAIVQAGFASADTVYVATGSNFPDALAGVPAAAGDAAPILLVQQNSIPAATATQLARLRPKTIKILGGEVVVSVLPVPNVARIDAELVQGSSAVGVLAQQHMAVVVKIPDQRYITPRILQSLLDLRNGTGGLFVVDRDSHQLGPGLG